MFSLYTGYFLVLMVVLTPLLLAIEAMFGMLIGFVCWVVPLAIGGVAVLACSSQRSNKFRVKQLGAR